jgi:hypothetical protein
MSDDSIVLKPHELFSDAILTQNADELAKFMDEPLTAIAEAITGALAVEPRAWMAMTGRIVQGILKARLFQQVGRELKDLRERGKIPDDFADEEHKYGFKSWVELLTIIDEETPDADRLEALKAMFYAVNKINVSDGERIAAYQLFQIAKKLTSSQLMYLRTCYELYKPGHYGNSANVPEHQWFELVGKRLGHTVVGLLNLDDAALAERELLTRRYRDSGGVNNQNARLSDLGINFCKNIETYRLETSRGAPE